MIRLLAFYLWLGSSPFHVSCPLVWGRSRSPRRPHLRWQTDTKVPVPKVYAVERVDCRQGCHGQGKVRERWKVFKAREKRKFFQGQGKVSEFFKKSGEIFDIVKVSEKWGNSVIQFIVHKFSSRFWNTFSVGKDENCAAKEGKCGNSTWCTPDTCSSCDHCFSFWTLSSKFLLPPSAKSRKRLKIKRKKCMTCKKT